MHVYCLIQHAGLYFRCHPAFAAILSKRLLLFFFVPSVVKSRGLKTRKRLKTVSEWLGVGVCLLWKTAVETYGIKSLNCHRHTLEQKCCFSLVASACRESVTELTEERHALRVNWTERLESKWNESMRACKRLVFGFLPTCRALRRSSCHGRRGCQV